MGMGISELAELLFQIMLMWVRVSVQAQKVDIFVIRVPVDADGSTICFEGEPWSVRILVGIEQDVGSIIFVVAGRIELGTHSRLLCDLLARTSIRMKFENIGPYAFGQVERSLFLQHVGIHL